MDTIIEEKILQDYKDYCEVNHIDLVKFLNKKLRDALMIEKYGETPFSYHEQVPYEAPRPIDEPEKNEEQKMVVEKISVEMGTVKKPRQRKPKKEEIKVSVKKEPKPQDGEKIIVKKRTL